MAKIIGYANYGILAREKQIIFTIGGTPETAKASDEVEITVPDDWKVSENKYGEPLLESPDGKKYRAGEVIESYGDNPVLEWYDGHKNHRVTMEWEAI